MKQQILAILDKSSTNGMKAAEIMEMFETRAADVAAKWSDIIEDDEIPSGVVLHQALHDMTCSQQVFNDGE